MTSTAAAPRLGRDLLGRLSQLRRDGSGPLTASSLILSEMTSHPDDWTEILALVGAPAIGTRRQASDELRQGQRERRAIPGQDALSMSVELDRALTLSRLVAAALRTPVVAPRHVVVALLLDETSSTRRSLVERRNGAAELLVAHLVSVDTRWLSDEIARLAHHRADREPASIPSRPQADDGDALLAAIDTVRHQGPPWSLFVVGVLSATVTVSLIAAGIGLTIFDWRPGWVKTLLDPPGAWIRQAAVLSAQGDHVGAAAAYLKAHELSPGRVAAINGRACELWALGYRDDALIDVQTAFNQPRWAPDDVKSWPADCILQLPLRSQLQGLASAQGLLMVVPTQSTAAKELIDAYESGPLSATGWRELLAAGCLNTLAGYDRLAAAQFNRAHLDPAAPAITGPIHDCLTQLVPQHYDSRMTTTGDTVLVPKDLASRVYEPGKSPVPPPTTLPLPATA